MPQQCNFRQLNEKQVVAEVDLMLWSPKMDLVAFSTTQGEVYLYRLSWQKVWSVTGTGQDIKVTTLAWRPDGKILAVGYSNGVINLHDVENSECVHTLHISGFATAMQWMVTSHSGDSQAGDCYVDNSSKYLPRLLSLSKNYGSLSKSTEENVEDSKRLNDITHLSFLVIGTSVGEVHLYALGIFHCGTIHLSSCHLELCSKVLSVQLSDDLKVLLIIACTENNSNDEGGEKTGDRQNIHMVSYQTPVLHIRQKEILALGLKYSKILALMDYLSFTVKAIGEAWEDVLLEIDDKLLKFSEEKQKLGEDGGTVSDDFLELLMFGVPSGELENFLLHTMTEKGLKKLGHSIEMSYSNIQKLVLKHLQSVGHSLVYHLSHLKGMTLWKERFGDFGLGPDTLERALASAGSFVMKALEIQQVIDHSMRNFKAVFRWLYAVILRLSDEQVPSEITRVTQQDLYFVAKFLRDNFTGNEINEEGASTSTEGAQRKGFSLERVGQYLKPQPLSIQENTMQNPWVQFLKLHPELDNSSGLIFHHDPKASLVQQHQELESIINETFSKPAQALAESLKIDRITKLHFDCEVEQNSTLVSDSLLRFIQMPVLKESPNSVLALGQFIQHQNTRSGIVNIPSQNCYLYGISHNKEEWPNTTTGLKIICNVPPPYHNTSASEKTYNFLDVQFYNEDTISFLLVEKSEQNKPPLLVQLPTSFLDSYIRECQNMQPSAQEVVFNIGDILDGLSYRTLENLKPCSLAVSGSRKVACVLFASRRRVRLFEMDVDDEEEEDGTDRGDADTSDGNISRKGPIAMQVSSQETDDENKENSSET